MRGVDSEDGMSDDEQCWAATGSICMRRDCKACAPYRARIQRETRRAIAFVLAVGMAIFGVGMVVGARLN